MGLYGMRTEIFCEIRVPDGGRCCGHAGERACLTGSPKGEKPDKGVSTDHILFSWLSSQFQDLVQRFLCTGTEFQVPVYCRSAPGGQVVEPVIRLDCQQMEIISDKPFDPAYFDIHPGKIVIVHGLDQDDGSIRLPVFMNLHLSSSSFRSGRPGICHIGPARWRRAPGRCPGAAFAGGKAHGFRTDAFPAGPG